METNPTVGRARSRPTPTRAVAAILLLLAGVLFGMSTSLPIVKLEDQSIIEFYGSTEVTLTDCGYEGCGWFLIEAVTLVVVAVSLGLLGLALPERWALLPASAGIVTGIWAITYFMGYWGAVSEESFGLGATPGSATTVGAAGGVAAFAAGVVLLVARGRSTPSTIPPPPTEPTVTSP